MQSTSTFVVGVLLALASSSAFSYENGTVLGIVPQAENLFIASDFRLFVSGAEGIYIVDQYGVNPAVKVPISFDATSNPSTLNKCAFSGIAQVGNALYASCTPDKQSASSPRYLMHMDTTVLPAKMRAIYKMTDAGAFNGMATDGNGNLFLANPGSTASAFGGRIVRLKLSSPTKVASQSTWLTVTAGRPNGIKILGSTLYFTQNPIFASSGASYLKQVAINSYGAAGVSKNLYSTPSGTLLDDFTLTTSGYLLAQADAGNVHNSPKNKFVHFSEYSGVMHQSSYPFALPSAVGFMKISNGSSGGSTPILSSAWIVTERGGKVSLVTQDWGTHPRQ